MRRTAVAYIIILSYTYTPTAVCAEPVNIQGHETIDSCERTDSIDSELDERLNPPELNENESVTPYLVTTGNMPHFVNHSANSIHLNGDNWDSLREALVQMSHLDVPFSILHIGDSHIQADAATGTTREILQSIYGNAGRGLITPLKMAKTNEPRDYRISSTSVWNTSKLMKMPWNSPMQFTGVSITPTSRAFNLNIATLSSDKVRRNPFCVLKIFYSGSELIVDNCRTDNKNIFYTCEYGDGIATLRFHNPVDSVNVAMHTETERNTVHIAGIELINSSHGLIYNTIGNNGAMFMSYNALKDFERISELNPQLVIIALGANESFGKVSDESFECMVDNMVSRVRKAVPNAKILLVTPMECQRKVSSYTRTRRGKRVRQKQFTINNNVLRLRNVINKYGQKNHIPVYDLYEIAGGTGSSNKWLADGLLNSKDRIHLTRPGYELQGRLTAEALLKAFATDGSTDIDN